MVLFHAVIDPHPASLLSWTARRRQPSTRRPLKLHHVLIFPSIIYVISTLFEWKDAPHIFQNMHWIVGFIEGICADTRLDVWISRTSFTLVCIPAQHFTRPGSSIRQRLLGDTVLFRWPVMPPKRHVLVNSVWPWVGVVFVRVSLAHFLLVCMNQRGWITLYIVCARIVFCIFKLKASKVDDAWVVSRLLCISVISSLLCRILICVKVLKTCWRV